MNFLTLSLIIPFITAGVVLLLSNSPRMRDGAVVIGGIITFSCVIALWFAVAGGEEILWLPFQIVGGVSFGFYPEPLGILFAATASFLWPLTSVYAIGYLRAGQDLAQTRFHAFFALAIGCTLGIAFSENILTLFLFYEFLTLATWPLVTHTRSQDAFLAGRVYLAHLFGTSIIFFLLAVVLMFSLGSSLSFRETTSFSEVPAIVVSLMVLLIVFGVGKAAVFPFHRWLPAAMVAPAPVSALLHAVAVVKAGAFSILKILTLVFGFDALGNLPLNDLLLFIPCVTIVGASLVALRQDDLKARLAYSTIGQLSYIVLAALLANQYAFFSGGLHIAVHAFGKITLFFCAGAIMVLAGKKKVSDFDGLGKIMPLTFFSFFLASLSMSGLPLLGGFWSKWYLLTGVLEAKHTVILFVLGLSTILNMYYLLSIPFRAFFLPAKDHLGEINLESNKALIYPSVITAAASVLLFFYASNTLVEWLKLSLL